MIPNVSKIKNWIGGWVVGFSRIFFIFFTLTRPLSENYMDDFVIFCLQSAKLY